MRRRFRVCPSCIPATAFSPHGSVDLKHRGAGLGCVLRASRGDAEVSADQGSYLKVLPGGSSSELIPGVGRILFLEVVGLKSPFACWLLHGGCSQLLACPMTQRISLKAHLAYASNVSCFQSLKLSFLYLARENPAFKGLVRLGYVHLSYLLRSTDQ